MEPNNTFTKYPGHELNPEKISSHGWQSAAYTPYGYNSQPTAAPGNYAHEVSTIDTVISCRSDTNYGTHSDTAPTRISYVHGGSAIDTVISCRSNTNYGTHRDTPSTRISSFHKSLDISGWSFNNPECNYKRELTTVTSNRYLHSSYPKSDTSSNQVNRRTEYGRYKKSPFHQSETSKKFYSNSDKWSKTLQSPISKSQSSVSPKDHGRVRNRSIESSSGFQSGRSDKYFKLNNKREDTTTMISNEHFHSLNPNYDKTINQSNIRIEYDRYKRSPSHGRETSKILYSHSDKSEVSPTSKPQKSVLSPKDRKRKRTPTSKSPESSRSVKLASPVDLGRKRSPSIEPSRLVLRSREEKPLRDTRRKSLEMRNNKNCERRSISPKQRSIRTVYPEGRRSSSPTSKSFNSRRSFITNRQRENAHSTSRTQSIHFKPRR